MNWGDVKTVVKDNLGRQNEATLDILLPLFAEMFQREVERDRNFFFLKTTTSRTIDQLAQSYALPLDFKDDLIFYIRRVAPDPEEFLELRKITDIDVIRKYSPGTANGQPNEPKDFTISNETITFWPFPDKQYTIRAITWKRLAAPTSTSADSFTNTWINLYPDLYVQALTEQGFAYLQEAQDSEIWKKKKEVSGRF